VLIKTLSFSIRSIDGLRPEEPYAARVRGSSMDSRLLYLALGSFAGNVEGALIVVVLPAIASETGVSIAQAGLLVFCYSIAYGFGTPLLSTLFGGVDRRTVVAGGELAFGIAALLMGLLPGYILLLVVRTFLACGAGMFTSTAVATAVAIAEPGKRGKAMSTVMLGATLGVAAGVPLAALIANLYGWRVAYIGIGVLGIAAAITLRLRLPDNLHGDTQTIRQRLSVVRIKCVPMLLLASGLMSISGFMLMTYLAPIATGEMGLAQEAMPVVMLVFGIGALAGNVLIGWLADRIGPRRTVLLAISATICLLVGMPLVGGLPLPTRQVAFIGCVGLFGMLTWGSFPAQLLRLATIAHRSMPLAASLNLTAGNLGVATAAVLGGFAFEQAGLYGIGWGGAAVGVLALVVSIMIPERPGDGA
jgi:MFS transporter, DHA1 family, inner membrane transport protein